MSSPTSSSPFRLMPGLALAALLSLLVGCANGEFRPKDPFDRGISFSESQHRYTVLIRFAEFQKAKAFVPMDERSEFLERMKAFERARITDYESEEADLDEEKRSATVRVVYKAYLPESPFEIELVEIQEWTREGRGNQWLVRPRFEQLPKVAAQ